MAKKSKVEREKRLKETVKQYEEERNALKRSRDYVGLSKLPRDASPTRIRNRCNQCGRSRAYIRRFGLCRICFREVANKGQIPGVIKSSW